jgi:hypothetical protein
MSPRLRPTLAVAALLAALVAPAAAEPAPVTVAPDAAAHRVAVTIGGKPFTDYRYEPDLNKPVLYPLRTDTGTIVTRGAPLDPQPGEPTDHPHHIGSWLTYGDVNGLDVWGNPPAKPGDRKAEGGKKGAIRHRKVVRAEGGPEKGELEVAADWVGADEKPLLAESTRFVFRGAPGLRAFDRATTLTAAAQRVLFKDTKEGMFGIRVAKSLQGDGKPGETGLYRSSEGATGKDVWSTRAKWMLLSGKVGDESVTIAVFDHPHNPNHPTYWHARTYGLFAANPLGQKDFDKAKGELGFSLEPGKSTTFRYRVLIVTGDYKPEQADAEFKKFAAEGP